MEDSIKQLAKLRARKSKKTPEEYAQDRIAETDLYEPIRLDDRDLEEKIKYRNKHRMFYDRLKDKG